MKNTLWILIFLLPFVSSYAQEDSLTTHNRSDFTMSLNVAGDVSILSLGFDKLFFIKPALTISGKLGLGFNGEFDLTDNPSNTYFILPHHVTANYGKKKSFLEFGIGGSFVTGSQISEYFVYPILGYRFHPFKNPGFSFRVWLFYPIGQTSRLEELNILLAPYGLSFGIAF